MKITQFTKVKNSKNRSSKLKLVLKSLFITFSVVSAVFLCYMFAGTADKNLSISYDVKVEKTSNGYLNVKMKISGNKKPLLHLYLADSRISKLNRISNIEVKSSGKTSRLWNTIPFSEKIPLFQDRFTVWAGFNKGDIEISYKVLATWDSPQIKEIRNYLSKDEGYVSGLNFLITPVMSHGIGAKASGQNVNSGNEIIAEVNFTLPEGWKVNSPWGDKPIKDNLSTIRGSIFYFNETNIIINNDTSVPFSLGKYGLSGDTSSVELEKFVVDVIKNAKSITGFEPISSAPYWAVSVVSKLSSGGMAGRNSLITSNDNSIIAHEIFHWWNGVSIKATKDSEWLIEGFTSYYSNKILHNIGYLNDGEFNQNIDKFIVGYKSLLPEGKINLISTSEKFFKGTATSSDQSTIYNFGMLVAYYLDKDLKSQNKSLDDIWIKLYELKRPLTSKEFFEILSTIGGEELSSKYYDIVKGKTSIFN